MKETETGATKRREQSQGIPSDRMTAVYCIPVHRQDFCQGSGPDACRMPGNRQECCQELVSTGNCPKHTPDDRPDFSCVPVPGGCSGMHRPGRRADASQVLMTAGCIWLRNAEFLHECCRVQIPAGRCTMAEGAG